MGGVGRMGRIIPKRYQRIATSPSRKASGEHRSQTGIGAMQRLTRRSYERCWAIGTYYTQKASGIATSPSRKASGERKSQADIRGTEVSSPKGIGGLGRMLPEKIGEMRDLFKTQAPGNLGNAPVGLFQQDLGFLYDPAADEGSSRFAGALL